MQLPSKKVVKWSAIDSQIQFRLTIYLFSYFLTLLLLVLSVQLGARVPEQGFLTTSSTIAPTAATARSMPKKQRTK
jgi:hypothetical protein